MGPLLTRTVTRDELVATNTPVPPSADESQALRRLLRIGRNDTHQSRHVADFLLAWWNAASCGGFDLTGLWAVDAPVANDMQTVFGLVTCVRAHPPTLDPALGADCRAMLRFSRPELAA